MSLEEGIVGQCIVSGDDGGGRSRKGWVGLVDGGIKKIGWIVMNDRQWAMKMHEKHSKSMIAHEK